MTEAELRDLAAAGVEIGAHTVSHRDLTTLDREACLSELTESRRTIERITGSRALTFAYPYCRYGSVAVAAVREAGFTAAVAGEGRGSWAPFELKRAMVTGKDGLPSFVMKLSDAYQPLFDSGPGRLARATTRGARRRIRARRERLA
jgi:peptidoglycan/xylan/chitin deacetylase (PgdA/CDA1 family)